MFRETSGRYEGGALHSEGLAQGIKAGCDEKARDGET